MPVALMVIDGNPLTDIRQTVPTHGLCVGAIYSADTLDEICLADKPFEKFF